MWLKVSENYRILYTTLAHLAVSALLALLIIRRTPSVLLGKMGLVSDGSARLERRPYQNQIKLFKSSDCEGFCLYTDFYRGAIKRSLNCQTSVQFLPLSSHLNLPLSYAPFGYNYVAYALLYKCNESV